MLNLEEIIEKIKQTPDFLKLKDVVENNAYHDRQKTFDHLVLTCNKAKEIVKGEFIADLDTRKKFLEFMNKDVFGMKRGDVLVIAALLHDIGKILWFKEGETDKPLELVEDGITSYPNHEYWGSTIVSDVLADLDFPEELIKYISDCVRMHATFTDSYLMPRIDFPFDKLINDVKSCSEGLYIETLFNQYCDGFYAEPFQYAIELITKIFNFKDLYTPRNYYIK